MANTFFNSYVSGVLPRTVNLAADTIKVALIDTAVYTIDPTDLFLSEIPGAALIGTAQTLANKVVTAMFDADDATWTGLVAAPAIGALLIYKDTGVAATSPLIFYMDDAFGFPTATGLSTVSAAWNVLGIFKVQG